MLSDPIVGKVPCPGSWNCWCGWDVEGWEGGRRGNEGLIYTYSSFNSSLNALGIYSIALSVSEDSRERCF